MECPMARAGGALVMTGSKHGEYHMRVEFSDHRTAIRIRTGGYYSGHATFAAMVEEMRKKSGPEAASARGTTAPQSANRNSAQSGDKVTDYTVFVGDESNPVSLAVLPLELQDRDAVTASEPEVCLCGKSGGSDVKYSITAWKLAFPEHEPFRILAKLAAVKRWVQLEEPRSVYKETAEDVFLAARFLAFLKKEPHASDENVRSHLLERGVLSCDRLRRQRSLIEQYIGMDPVLKEADAMETYRSLTREKVAGKRVLVLNNGSSDEEDDPPVKRPRVDHVRSEEVSSAEEDFYEDEEMIDDDDDDDDDDPGDSLCIVCDDGGFLLCCDGPCMRSFHPRPKDGINGQCVTLGFPDESDIEKFRRGWFCTNCKTKRHQCYVCGELGDSDPALGRKREVFVCDVASCGKFYHPRCIASELIQGAGEREAREALAKGIRTGEESFTCPLHRCKKCGKGEEKKERDLNLATCRRCPAAWHVKCLPRALSFKPNEESRFQTRAWELGKRFIVYCTNHKILTDLSTPLRNHIKFKDKSSEATTALKKSQTKVGNERPEVRIKAPFSAVPQILVSTDAAKPVTQQTSDVAAKRLVKDIVDRSRRAITEDSVLGKLILPMIYRRREFTWMLQGRFESILNGARAAMERLKQGSSWEEAKLKCAPEQVEAVSHEENHLRTFLAPTLHGKRYTSYGRHFTKVEKLKKVVEALQPHIRDGDTIVDFSCGDNSFSRLLHDALSNSEKRNCLFKNFDIFTPKDTLGFERRDWLSVGANDCGAGDNLVIGLNPPFMYTDVFVSHALSMNPRVLVFIVPPLKKPLSHYGYQCVLDDPTTMAEKSFYLAGSVHGLNDDHIEQGNHVAPHLYIFMRTGTSGDSNPPPTVKPGSTMNPSLSKNPSQKIRKSKKRVSPATPTDPSADLFIPQQRLRDPARPRHRMPKRMSPAPGVGSQMEEGGSLFRPPPRHLPPLPFHDRPRDYPFPSPLHFHPHHHPEFRPRDESYPPFERAPLHPNGIRGFPYAVRGFPYAVRGFPPPPRFEDMPPAFGGSRRPPLGVEDLPPAFGGWLPSDY